jgi:hypothetical protein
MITLKVILVVIALVSTAILALSIRIVLVKDGKFPETHISRNPEMKKRGILIVKRMDQMEEKAKGGLQTRYKNVTIN